MLQLSYLSHKQEPKELTTFSLLESHEYWFNCQQI